MKNWILTIAALAALTPFAASAEDVSYSYVQIDYINLDIDDGGDDSGFGLAGSFTVSDNFHIALSHDSVDILGADLTWTTVGFGYHTDGDTSYYAQINYEDLGLDTGAADIGDSGFGIEVGVRSMINENFELQGGIHYADFGDFGDDTLLELSGRYYVNDQFSIGVKYEAGSDFDIWGIGGRFDFGG